MAPSDGFSFPASTDAPPLTGGPPPATDPAASPAAVAAVPSRAAAPPPGQEAPAARPPSPAMTYLALAVVSILGFLLASFPAHNSDAWAHLASGRRLAGGEISFGADARTVPDLSISPTWIYDLISYLVYQNLGGFGLVFLKALLAAALAVVMFRLSRVGAGWWAPALGATLALLAMGARLLLQPATVSYLLLALTLLLLRRFSRGEETPEASRSPAGSRLNSRSALAPPWLPPWPLAALFVLWANLDGWFVFGLGVVGLWWLGEALDFAARQAKETLTPAERRRVLLAWVPRVLVSLIVLDALCLLNPSHVYAFTPALELMGSSFVVAGPSGVGQVASPFQSKYLTVVAFSPAGLAYFPLLALSLVSFLLNLPRWPWRRFLPWVGLALLSVLQARAIPLFAVVAGPVLAWNLHEFFARRADLRPQPAWRGSAVAVGRGLAVGLGLVFLACAWPGWLQTPPFGPRLWAVDPSPSLERGAAAVREWHRDGKLGAEARGLFLSQETAQAFAWFCPEEKGLLDARLASAVGALDGREGWARQLRAAGVNHVIVNDPDRGRLYAVLDNLAADPRQWPLLYEEGDLAVFGWRDPERAREEDAFRSLEMDLNQLAFHPAEDRKAPPRPAGRAAAEPPWWEAFWKSPPPAPIDRQEATMRLFHAEASRRSVGPWQLAGWVAGQEAALVGGAAGWSSLSDLFDARIRLTMVTTPPPSDNIDVARVPIPEQWAILFQKAYAFEQDDAPPALLYLAVRAARRAAAANPNDEKAYEVLGESYLRLQRSTRERAWAERLPPLLQLRYAQASAAFNQAVALKPDYAKPHLQLYDLYKETGCNDLALEHLRTYLTLARQAGPPSGANIQEFWAQAAQYQAAVDNLAKEVQQGNDEYALRTVGMPVLRRAAVALDKGLAGKARDMLLKSDVSAFGKDGMALELELLLRTGRPRDVYDWTGPDQQAALGDSVKYHWLRAQAMAAVGDYALAEEECAAMAPSAGLGERTPTGMGHREAVAVVVGRRLLDECPGPGLPYQLRWPFGRAEFRNTMGDLSQNLRQEANTTVLWGLLALEQGEVNEAKLAFRKVLDIWRDEATAASGAGMDFEGRVIAQGCLERLK